MKNEGIGARKRKRSSSVEKQKKYRERNQRNLEMKERERERKAKFRKAKTIEIEVLRTELERERAAKERWRLKYIKIKCLYVAAEMKREVIDITQMAIPVEPQLPSSEPKVFHSFHNIVRENEEMFTVLLGMSLAGFNFLLGEVREIYFDMTMDGQKRKRARSQEETMPIEEVLSMTLFWLREYPSMILLSALFHRHPRTLVKFLKRMIKSLKEVLKNEVTWPTEEEWADILKKFNPLLPSSLEGCVAVVDGSEFKIQRPSKEPYQWKHFSVKKKQHSLNALFIVLLDGRIIYHSPLDAGSCDQNLWNKLELRKRFEGKTYGIMGDGGFTFNQKTDDVVIRGEVPKKKPKKTKANPNPMLSSEEKERNKVLSSYRVIVENTLGQLKHWKILSGKFRHYTASSPIQKISFEDILDVCTGFTNQKLKSSPLRAPGWAPTRAPEHDVLSMTWLFQNALNLE